MLPFGMMPLGVSDSIGGVGQALDVMRTPPKPEPNWLEGLGNNLRGITQDPIFMLGLGLLTNEGRLNGNVIQGMQGAARMQLAKKDRERADQQLKLAQEAEAKKQKALSSLAPLATSLGASALQSSPQMASMIQGPQRPMMPSQGPQEPQPGLSLGAIGPMQQAIQQRGMSRPGAIPSPPGMGAQPPMGPPPMGGGAPNPFAGSTSTGPPAPSGPGAGSDPLMAQRVLADRMLQSGVPELQQQGVRMLQQIAAYQPKAPDPTAGLMKVGDGKLYDARAGQWLLAPGESEPVVPFPGGKSEKERYVNALFLQQHPEGGSKEQARAFAASAGKQILEAPVTITTPQGMITRRGLNTSRFGGGLGGGAPSTGSRSSGGGGGGGLSGFTEKPMAEAERRVGALGSTAAGKATKLASLVVKHDMSALEARAAGVKGARALAPRWAKDYDTNLNGVINDVNYIVSGAASTDKEIQAKKDLYGPVLGDDHADILLKQDLLLQDLEAQIQTGLSDGQIKTTRVKRAQRKLKEISQARAMVQKKREELLKGSKGQGRTFTEEQRAAAAAALGF